MAMPCLSFAALLLLASAQSAWLGAAKAPNSQSRLHSIQRTCRYALRTAQLDMSEEVAEGAAESAWRLELRAASPAAAGRAAVEALELGAISATRTAEDAIIVIHAASAQLQAQNREKAQRLLLR